MTDWIRLDSTLALPHIDPKQFSANEKRIPKLHQALHQKTLPGNEFLGGWIYRKKPIRPKFRHQRSRR